MSCFLKDNSSNDIVTFDEVLETSDYYLTFHRIFTYLICTTTVLLNTLVGYIILTSNNNVCLMRPILLLNSFIDGVWALALIITCRYNFTGYFRYLCYSNSLLAFDRSTMANFIAFEIAVMIIGWDLVPIQFLYRYCLIKHGRTLRGLRLFLFIGVCAVYTGLHVYSGTPLFVFRSWNEQFQTNAVTLLHHYGYNIEKERVYGVVIGVTATTYYSALRPYFFITTNFAIILLTSIAVNQKLKRIVISPSTRRLHSLVLKMLTSLALSSLASCVIPNLISTNTVISCTHHKWLTLMNSMILLSEPLMSPIFSLYFLAPYRSAFHHMIGYVFGSSRVTTVINTPRATVTTVPPKATNR